VEEGCAFLGFEFRKPPRRLLWPRQKACQHIGARVSEVVRSFPSSATVGEVIRKLHPILNGWCTYFRVGNSNRIFHQIDWAVQSELQLWLRRKHQCSWRSARKRWNDPSAWLAAHAAGSRWSESRMPENRTSGSTAQRACALLYRALAIFSERGASAPPWGRLSALQEFEEAGVDAGRRTGVPPHEYRSAVSGKVCGIRLSARGGLSGQFRFGAPY
jgi:hypothetical protein